MKVLLVALAGLGTVLVAVVIAFIILTFAATADGSSPHGATIQGCVTAQADHAYSKLGHRLPASHPSPHRSARARSHLHARQMIVNRWMALYCSGRSLGPATSGVFHLKGAWAQEFAKTAHRLIWHRRGRVVMKSQPGVAARVFSADGIKAQWGLPVPAAWLKAFYAGANYGPATEPVRTGRSLAWQQQTFTTKTGTLIHGSILWSAPGVSPAHPAWKRAALAVTRFGAAVVGQDGLGSAQYLAPTLANTVISDCVQQVLNTNGWPSKFKFAFRYWNPGSAEVKMVLRSPQSRVVERLTVKADKPWKITAVQTAHGGAASVQCPPWSPPSNAFPNTYAVGDSVTVDAEPYLQAMGITVDAAVSRFFDTGISILQQMKDEGTLPPRVVIALGTNGGMTLADLDSAMTMLKGESRIVLVTVREPRSWQDEVNQNMRTAARQYKNVRVADWFTASAGHAAWFAPDGIHIGPEGAEAFAHVIANALAEP